MQIFGRDDESTRPSFRLGSRLSAQVRGKTRNQSSAPRVTWASDRLLLLCLHHLWSPPRRSFVSQPQAYISETSAFWLCFRFKNQLDDDSRARGPVYDLALAVCDVGRMSRPSPIDLYLLASFLSNRTLTSPCISSSLLKSRFASGSRVVAWIRLQTGFRRGQVQSQASGVRPFPEGSAVQPAS
jgi:hypothetical protein